MATPKRTRNRIKLAAVLALGMATMPLNGCDAGAIMGIIQAVAPIAQQIIGQIAEDNGGGSGIMGGESYDGNSSAGGTSDPFGTGGVDGEGDEGLTTEEVADAAVDDNGSLDSGFETQTTEIDGGTSADAALVVDGAST
jgi:hypothetical protein